MLTDYIKKYRVLVLAKVSNYEKKNEKIEALGFILLQDKVRKEAKKTLEYFKEQGVTIKIISGDNPLTVAAIAKKSRIN